MLLLALPARAQDALVTYKSLGPEVALDLARATLAACRERGFQVAVAVVDRFGVTQVVLRDRFAGPHTVPTATGKAWTAVEFRTNTSELPRRPKPAPQSGIRALPGVVAVGGGLIGRSRRLAGRRGRGLGRAGRRCGRGLRQGRDRGGAGQAGVLTPRFAPAICVADYGQWFVNASGATAAVPLRRVTAMTPEQIQIVRLTLAQATANEPGARRQNSIAACSSSRRTCARVSAAISRPKVSS